MSRELEERLALCRTLPSLPAVALRIIELAENPDVELTEVAQAIALDPALSTKLLRIANSPLYASKRRIDNLRQALTLLGLNATLSLALSFSLSKTLRQPWGQRFDFQSVMRRSILAASAARCLGERMGLHRGEDLMLAGLIQDIGILALGQIEPDIYATVLADAVDNSQLVALERQRLGTDHAQIGARLAANWGLPEFLVQAIRQSESAQPEGEFNLCIALSGPLADIWVVDDPAPAREAAAALCQRHLGMDETALAELTAEISASIPEISSLFDMTLADPQRIDAILELARELMVIRNLRGVQEATRERREAERLHSAARALQDSAHRDPLTGLFSRPHLETQFETAFAAASANGRPLSLAVIDIDDLASINQKHDRMAGDALLRGFADLLRANVRDSDFAARFGSDAFCLLLPNTADNAAFSLCWRILQATAGAPLAQHDKQPLHATVSIGVATLDHLHHYATSAALLDAAEYALQFARDAGGNRVERAGF